MREAIILDAMRRAGLVHDHDMEPGAQDAESERNPVAFALQTYEHPAEYYRALCDAVNTRLAEASHPYDGLRFYVDSPHPGAARLMMKRNHRSPIRHFHVATIHNSHGLKVELVGVDLDDLTEYDDADVKQLDGLEAGARLGSYIQPKRGTHFDKHGLLRLGLRDWGIANHTFAGQAGLLYLAMYHATRDYQQQ